MIDIEAIKQQKSCQAYLASKGYALAGRGEEKYIPTGCPICGTSHPGSSDRCRVWPTTVWCRNSACPLHNNGKGVDIITLTRLMEHTDFRGAAKMLDTLQMPEVKIALPERKPWNARLAAEKANECHTTLMASNNIGIEYLTRRGITPNAAIKYNLGITSGDNPSQQPAITIPWYRGKECVAIHYRYIDLPQITKPAKKMDSEPGSTYKGNLYGGHALTRGDITHRRLLMLEGEINAISAWQAAGDYVDVLSVGSESMLPTPEQCDYLIGYDTKLVWMDKPERAQALADTIGGRWISSARLGGDANDLLKAETLGVTLAKAFLAITGETNRKQLLWDLSEAKLDDATKQYCNDNKLWEKK